MKALCRNAFVLLATSKVCSECLQSVGGDLQSFYITDQWFSKCGPLISNISITWELVSNANSQAPPWNQKLEMRTRNLFFFFLKQALQMFLMHFKVW